MRSSAETPALIYCLPCHLFPHFHRLSLFPHASASTRLHLFLASLHPHFVSRFMTYCSLPLLPATCSLPPCKSFCVFSLNAHYNNRKLCIVSLFGISYPTFSSSCPFSSQTQSFLTDSPLLFWSSALVLVPLASFSSSCLSRSLSPKRPKRHSASLQTRGRQTPSSTVHHFSCSHNRVR